MWSIKSRMFSGQNCQKKSLTFAKNHNFSSQGAKRRCGEAPSKSAKNTFSKGGDNANQVENSFVKSTLCVLVRDAGMSNITEYKLEQENGQEDNFKTCVDLP